MPENDLPETPEDYDEYFRDRVDRLNQAIETFQVEVDLSGPDIAERFREVAADLSIDADRVRQLAGRLRDAAGETWRNLRDGAERAYDRLESSIATAWADLRAERANEPADYAAAAAEQAESWRTHLDRLKLHARLAEMDARDAVASLEDAYAQARPELEQAGEAAGEAFDTLKDHGRQMVSHLRQAAKDLARSLD